MREISQFYFQEGGIFFALGPQGFDVLVLSDSAVKLVSSLNLKRISAPLQRMVVCERYSFVLSPQFSEILVLRGELAVSFITGELLTGRVTTTCRTTFKALQQRRVEEEITSFQVLEDRGCWVLAAGTSAGRVHVYCVQRVEAQGMGVQVCRTAGGLSLPVAEAYLVLTQELCPGPLRSMDRFQRTFLAESGAGELFSSALLGREYFEGLRLAEEIPTEEEEEKATHSPLAPVFDSVAKLQTALADPRKLRLQEDELFQLNPMRLGSKLSIQGLEAMDPLQRRLYKEPSDWPRMVRQGCAWAPFYGVFQTISGPLACGERDGVQFLQSQKTGLSFSLGSRAATALAGSDDSSVLFVGDAEGVLYVFSLETLQPISQRKFSLPEGIDFSEPMDEEDSIGEEDAEGFTMRARQRKERLQGQREDAMQRTYRVDCIAAHPGGMQLAAALSSEGARYPRLQYCLALYDVVQGDLVLRTLVEQDYRVIALRIDQTGNFLYAVTEQKLCAFTLYEMRMLAALELSLARQFVNPAIEGYFSPEHQQKMRAQNEKNTQDFPKLVPTCVTVSQGVAIVGFQDGDIALFDCLTGRIVQKYLQAGVSQRYPVAMQVQERYDDPENVQQQTALQERQAGLTHVPLLVSFSDGQVVEVWPSGPRRSLCTQGVNSANSSVNCIALLPGLQQIHDWVARGALLDGQDRALQEALQLGRLEQERPKEFLLAAGDSGCLQILSLQSQRAEKSLFYQLHAAEITALCVVRECFIVTASTDGHLLVSQLVYPEHQDAVPKPTPRAILQKKLQVRPRGYQTVLDLLFFELLGRMVLLEGESQRAVLHEKQQAEEEVRRMWADFQVLYRKAEEEIQAAGARGTRLQQRQAQQLRESEQKLQTLNSELEQTYQEQIEALKQACSQLQTKHILQREQGDAAVFSYQRETEDLVQDEQNATIREIERLRDVYVGLQQDEAALRELAELQTREATERYEREVTSLKRELDQEASAQSQEVARLRSQQSQMEAEFQRAQEELSQIKTGLNRVRNSVLQQQHRLSLQKHQEQIQRQELSGKADSEKRKDSRIQELEKEKEDLQKLRLLLRQRVGDLGECIRPRDEQIASVQATVSDMDRELARDLQERRGAELRIQDLSARKQSLEQAIREKGIAVVRKEAAIRDLLLDLSAWCQSYQRHLGMTRHQALKHVQRAENFVSLDHAHQDFVTALKILYAKHVDTQLQAQLQARLGNNEGDEAVAAKTAHIKHILNQPQQQPLKIAASQIGAKAAASQGADKKPQPVHQREYLEKSVNTLEKSLERRRQQLSQAIERSRQQSGTLLAFSNLMRRENKELLQKLRDTKYQLAAKKEKLRELADSVFGQKIQAMLAEERELQDAAQELQDFGDTSYFGEFKGKTLDQVLQEQDLEAVVPQQAVKGLRAVPPKLPKK